MSTDRTLLSFSVESEDEDEKLPGSAPRDTREYRVESLSGSSCYKVSAKPDETELDSRPNKRTKVTSITRVGAQGAVNINASVKTGKRLFYSSKRSKVTEDLRFGHSSPEGLTNPVTELQSHQYPPRFRHLYYEDVSPSQEGSIKPPQEHHIDSKSGVGAFRPLLRATISHGVCSDMGKRPYMEDTHMILPEFHEYLPSRVEPAPEGSTKCRDKCNEVFYCGIFDGHCGSRAAHYARTHMHRILKLYLELQGQNEFECSPIKKKCHGNLSHKISCLPSERELLSNTACLANMNSLYDDAFLDTFLHLDRDFLRQFPGCFSGSTALVCTVDMDRNPEAGGTGARSSETSKVVSLVEASSSWLHLAHVGDCRAVLGRTRTIEQYYNCFKEASRNALRGFDEAYRKAATEYKLPGSLALSSAQCSIGSNEKIQWSSPPTGPLLKGPGGSHVSQTLASRSDTFDCIPLTEDHKPSRKDELKRIEEVGGKVIHSGVPRVGVVGGCIWLAVSRAIGDAGLKKAPHDVVSAEPECTHRKLLPYRDAFLVLASDGIWDVCSNEEVINLVGAHLISGKHESADVSSIDDRDSTTANSLENDRPRKAAEAVVQLGLSKGTSDNVTCIVLEISWAFSTA